ncbi:MAG: hypothetical protein NT002_00775 [candidate division Zixibacteria bacterium]|nr:hypothetical protein [candidate division Zixibacteria bacterium]
MEKMPQQSQAKDVKTKVKKARHRSPNYPSLSLTKALEKVKQIYDVYKTNWIPERTAHETWGNAAFGSQGLLSIAALKAYGLIQVDGTGKDRKISISETSRRILLDPDESDDLLSQCALLPPIHKEIWDYYSGFLPKNDNDLRKYLLLEKHFNELSVDSFIAQLRSTIALTKPESDVKLSKDEQDEEKSPDKGVIPMGESLLTKTETEPKSVISPKSDSLTRDYTIPRKGQKLAILRLEYPITKDDIEQITKWLELMRGTITEE